MPDQGNQKPLGGQKSNQTTLRTTTEACLFSVSLDVFHIAQDVSLSNGWVKVPFLVAVVALGENTIPPCSDDPMKDKSTGFEGCKSQKIAQTR